MAVAQGDPNRQIRGLQAGAGLFARLSVTLVHQKSYLASGEHAPLRYSLAQEGENRGREGGRERRKKKRKKKKLTYVFSSPTCNTPLWRWGEARPVNEKITTLIEPSSGQPLNIELLGFSRSIFTLANIIYRIGFRSFDERKIDDGGNILLFILLGKSSGEYSAVQQQYSTGTTLVLKLCGLIIIIIIVFFGEIVSIV